MYAGWTGGMNEGYNCIIQVISFDFQFIQLFFFCKSARIVKALQGKLGWCRIVDLEKMENDAIDQ
jgi:hypothetical protein